MFLIFSRVCQNSLKGLKLNRQCLKSLSIVILNKVPYSNCPIRFLNFSQLCSKSISTLTVSRGWLELETLAFIKHDAPEKLPPRGNVLEVPREREVVSVHCARFHKFSCSFSNFSMATAMLSLFRELSGRGCQIYVTEILSFTAVQ